MFGLQSEARMILHTDIPTPAQLERLLDAREPSSVAAIPRYAP
jgi:hypothetical protein